MKKNVIFFLIGIICLHNSCKKESKRILNPTYLIDSVRVEYMNPLNPSVSYSYLIPVNSLVLDSIDVNSEEIFLRNDTLVYQGMNEYTCGPFIQNFVAIINNRPKSSNFYYPDGSCAQYGHSSGTAEIVFTPNNIIDSFLTTYFNTSIWSSQVIYDTTAFKFNYSNNLLTSLSSLNIRHIHDGPTASHTDTTIQGVINFGYTSNIANQQDLIGLDLNDLILGDLLSDLGMDFKNDLQKKILFNSGYKLNTNCIYLIENIQNSGVNYAIEYTLDNNHNNRVSQVKITITNSGATSIYNYKLYFND